MRLSKIANLILVRDFLKISMNNTSIISKDRYKEVDRAVTELDKIIVDGALAIDLDDVGSEYDYRCESCLPVEEIKEEKEVLDEDEPVQLALKFIKEKDDREANKEVVETKPEEIIGEVVPEPLVNKLISSSADQEEEDRKVIRNRLAEEKKKVAGRKQKGVVKRSEE
jgi:hypothetical protein